MGICSTARRKASKWRIDDEFNFELLSSFRTSARSNGGVGNVVLIVNSLIKRLGEGINAIILSDLS